MADVAERVAAVRARLRELAGTRAVRLMAVTKTQSRARALEAVAAGVDLLGENRIQEIRAKWGTEPPPVPLHLIGHLQTNKVKYAIEYCQAIDSVDGGGVAAALEARLARLGRDPLPVMVEVNPGREPQKTGLFPEQVRPLLERGGEWPHLRFVGLMAVLPRPRDRGTEEARRIRRLMQETGELWRMSRAEGWPWAPLGDLSMGMSGDWEWAVEAGATMIRLGEALFGPRGSPGGTAGNAGNGGRV
ncbi:Pyridoxal phosphate homeostasis protein [Candidatus Hydrogenisulfobacillus filiaventi]|uniref:Pyridoxal phosphate homeostasis protein n=1 Tax=Candidatus Hydrogenisulfobacillus filiaventi TaxID=2707344 RepID=A0A6F8ZFV7_9FIRM|nr:YggS family pyridoxal phosphate-dependent enzyme [Bacillota bacterium]CAB1128479.1 Pyridoxal phosphate homeostasis protein [Candidatus Hydrogenisulfobacillus filiaventi]